MSNRQARREQSRATRQPTNRPQRSNRTPAGAPRKPPSNIPDFLSPGFITVAVVVVLALVVLGVVVVANSGGDSESQAADQLRAAAAELPIDMTEGTRLGSDDAPLKLTAFEDFQCPFCLRYNAEDEPMIINEYVKTGKVQIEYKHLPLLGPESVAAAKASECAARQDKFWQFKDKLFLVQAEAGQMSNEKRNVGRFSDENLRKYAEEVGVDLAAYDACIADPAIAQKVADDNRAATQLGITGTPNFLFNGRPIQGGGTPGSLDAWRAILDDQIAEANATPTETASDTPSATGTASAEASPSAAATTTPTAAQ